MTNKEKIKLRDDILNKNKSGMMEEDRKNWHQRKF
jgi:hypothetical protein